MAGSAIAFRDRGCSHAHSERLPSALSRAAAERSPPITQKSAA